MSGLPRLPLKREARRRLQRLQRRQRLPVRWRFLDSSPCLRDASPPSRVNGPGPSAADRSGTDQYGQYGQYLKSIVHDTAQIIHQKYHDCAKYCVKYYFSQYYTFIDYYLYIAQNRSAVLLTILHSIVFPNFAYCTHGSYCTYWKIVSIQAHRQHAIAHNCSQ